MYDALMMKISHALSNLLCDDDHLAMKIQEMKEIQYNLSPCSYRTYLSGDASVCIACYPDGGKVSNYLKIKVE